MKVLRHHHVSDYDESVATAHLLQDFEKQITPIGTGKQRTALVTTRCDERQISGAVVPVQSVGHRAKQFYEQLAAPVLIGMEATGNSQWFIELVEDLGHEIWIADA